MKRLLFVGFVFFLCLLALPAWAANTAPQAISVTPASGTFNVGSPYSFTTIVSDPDGYQDIYYALLMINKYISSAQCPYLFYNSVTNKLYLRNDNSSAWLGGFAPGSANVIENSFVKLDCQNSAVVKYGTTVTVIWGVTFKTPFTGAKKLYLYALDRNFVASGWQEKGSIAIPNSAPQTVSINPNAGTLSVNTPYTFNAVYSDADTGLNIFQAFLMINSGLSGTNGYYAYYYAPGNKLYLRNDGNTAWLGGFAPGSANVIENSYAKLDCQNTTVNISGNNLTVGWKVIFKAPFLGVKKEYLNVIDYNSAASGWQEKGSFAIPNHAPQAVSISPNSGALNINTPYTFSAIYSDADTSLNIYQAFLIINTTLNATNGYYAYYYALTNKLYLRNDANTAWLGGFAPGSANVIENSFAKLDCQNTTVNSFGNNLTVGWKVTFKAPFTGTKKQYMYALDRNSANSGWQERGNFTIPNGIPQVVSAAPNSGKFFTDTPYTFTTVVSDADGYRNIYYTLFMIDQLVSGRCPYFFYNFASNKLYLRNDDNSAWLGGFAPGSANVIENSFAKLDCQNTTINTSGNELTVNWRLTFNSTFTGDKKQYVYAVDNAFVSSGWKDKGSIKIKESTADQFVVVSGNRLALEETGTTYYFSVANQYYLFYKPQNLVDEVFNDAAAMGINVIRTWGFCDGMSADGVSFQPGAGVYSETGFARMDYIIKKAREMNMRLIIPLVNNWDDFGGMNAYVRWASATASAHDDFYTDAYCKKLYKDYVQYFLERTNALTGIKYKDDPTILILELANEPRHNNPSSGELKAWVDEMAAFIKTVDQRHLVSTGSEGYYNGVGPEIDYVGIHQSPDIDICSFHFYKEYGFSDAQFMDWIDRHIDDAHFVINKPVYCGEMGMKVVRGASDAAQQMTERNRLYTDWYNLFSERVIDGAGFWILSADAYADYDNYTVYYPADVQTCSIISNFANTMSARSGLNYFLPIINTEDKQGNNVNMLTFDFPMSNPYNLSIMISSDNLPADAFVSTSTGTPYFAWNSPVAGNYPGIKINLHYGDFTSSDTMDLTIADYANDTPQMQAISPIYMDKNTIRDNIVDLWAITTDGVSSQDQITYTVTVTSHAGNSANCGITVDGNHYIDIRPPQNVYGYFTIRVTATDEKGLQGSVDFWLTIKKNSTIKVPSEQPTITQALTFAMEGDTIMVAPGTYNESVNFASIYLNPPTGQGEFSGPFPGITLISEAGPQDTIIDAGGDNYGIYLEQRSHVQGFTIRNARSAGVRCRGDFLSPHHSTDSAKIIGNIIEDNTGQGILGYFSTGLTIANNVICNNISSGYGGGIRLSGHYSDIPQGSTMIYNNVITDNTAIDGAGLYLTDGVSVVVMNNIVVNNRAEEYGGGIRTWNSSVDMTYNDVWNNTPNNYYFQASPGSGGTGSKSEDPLLDSSHGLLSGSPCIDTGNPASEWNDLDGTRNDMGIYGGPLATMREPGVIRVPRDYATISAAIAAAEDGDTISVTEGTYRESLYINKSITLTGELDVLKTIIDAGGATYVICLAKPNITVKGFTLKNGSSFGILGATYTPDVPSGSTIINNVIENNGGPGIRTYFTNNLTITGNVIRNNDSTRESESYGGGIRLSGGSSGSKIINNTITNNRAGQGGGIFISDSAGVLVCNNIIVNNTATYGGGVKVWAALPVLEYNDVWNNTPNSYDFNGAPGCTAVNSISLDPLFYGFYVFYLGSPCIDAGNPDTRYNDRNGTRNDMGARGGPNTI